MATCTTQSPVHCMKVMCEVITRKSRSKKKNQNSLIKRHTKHEGVALRVTNKAKKQGTTCAEILKQGKVTKTQVKHVHNHQGEEQRQTTYLKKRQYNLTGNQKLKLITQNRCTKHNALRNETMMQMVKMCTAMSCKTLVSPSAQAVIGRGARTSRGSSEETCCTTQFSSN